MRRRKLSKNRTFDDKEDEDIVPGPEHRNLDIMKNLCVYWLDSKQICKYLFSLYSKYLLIKPYIHMGL